MDFSGAERTLSLRARAADPADAEEVSAVFGGEAVESLLDLRWHKVALSVRGDSVTLHVDCNPVETRQLEPRGAVHADGHTLLAVRASDAGAIQVRILMLSESFDVNRCSVTSAVGSQAVNQDSHDIPIKVEDP